MPLNLLWEGLETKKTMIASQIFLHTTKSHEVQPKHMVFVVEDLEHPNLIDTLSAFCISKCKGYFK